MTLVDVYLYVGLFLINMQALAQAIKMKPYVMSETGEVVFRHGLARKRLTTGVFVCELVFLIVGFIGTFLSSFDPYYTSQLPEVLLAAVLGVIFFGGILGALFIVEFTKVFKTSYTITKEGIIMREWSSRTLIKWSNIERVRISSFIAGRELIFRTPEMKINLSLNRQGRKIAARAIKDHLPVDTWRQAEKAIVAILAR
ncbi:MAG TPA: hypothetical protein VE439_05045 [Anaerolineae bacterium]|nr:hypothetical protein [Anaerolineae bacterium]